MRAGFWVCHSSNRLSSQVRPRSCVSYPRICDIVSQFSIHLPSPPTYFHKSCIVFKIWCRIIFDANVQPNCSHHHLSISHETLTPTVDPRKLRALKFWTYSTVWCSNRVLRESSVNSSSRTIENFRLPRQFCAVVDPVFGWWNFRHWAVLPLSSSSSASAASRRNNQTMLVESMSTLTSLLLWITDMLSPCHFHHKYRTHK